MSGSRSPLSPAIETLLAREREMAPLPASVRARALARARAALVAGSVRSHARPLAVSRLRWAVAAAFLCVASAAIGAVAYEVRARLTPPAPRAVPPAPPVEVAPRPTLSVPPPAADTPPAPRGVRPTPRRAPALAVEAELALLKQAGEAVARGDYAAALAPIAEHLRRFRDGRLAEEREALRVRALAALGRFDDAQRAAAAFRVRFPRSVLLPAIRQMPGAEP